MVPPPPRRPPSCPARTSLPRKPLPIRDPRLPPRMGASDTVAVAKLSKS